MPTILLLQFSQGLRHLRLHNCFESSKVSRSSGYVSASFAAGSRRPHCGRWAAPTSIQDRPRCSPGLANPCSRSRRGPIGGRCGNPHGEEAEDLSDFAGFLRKAIAAPLMKAALEAWGAESNLFHQGAAKRGHRSGRHRRDHEEAGRRPQAPRGVRGSFWRARRAAERSRSPRKEKGRPETIS
jgi:hypothetical protein